MKTNQTAGKKNDSTQSIRDFFHQTTSFVITSHVRPDGDAIGSVLAVGQALMEMGKTVQMVLGDGLPKSFRFLAGSEAIQKEIKGEYNALISLDSSDTSRLGRIFQDLLPDLNIDHHITNEYYAAMNWVEPGSSATCEILTDHFPEWGLPLTPAIAEALLAGILIDTIGFKTPNVTKKTLRLTADLIENGANLSALYKQALDTHRFEALRYWGSGFNKMQIHNQIVWTSLSLDDRRNANYHGNDDADLINMLTTIEDSLLAMIFVEQNDGSVKVSWRAKPGWDVSKIAMEFGGGGHQAAAGAEIEGSLENVQSRVLAATKKLIE